MVSKTKRLRAAYEDADGARAEEIAALGGAGEEAYGAFYDRLKETREYHRAYRVFRPHVGGFPRALQVGSAPRVQRRGARRSLPRPPRRAPRVSERPLRTQDGLRRVPRRRPRLRVRPSRQEKSARRARLPRRATPTTSDRSTAASARSSSSRRSQQKPSRNSNANGTRAPCPDGRIRACAPRAWRRANAWTSAFATVDEMAASLSPDDVRAALGAMGLKQGGTEEQRRDRLWSTRAEVLGGDG